MNAPLVWYLQEFLRLAWVKKFFFAKTAPLTTPSYFRGFPELTGRMCQHALSCMMVCPAPGAIEVVREGKGWVPRIIKGHCIRCGLCVEACPHGVLTNGRVLESISRDNTALRFRFLITVDTDRCMGCGICAVACPVNKVIDKQMAYGGHASTSDLLLRIDEGKSRVLHEEKCTGCQTCEENCPNDAIHVARLLEAIHLPDETGADQVLAGTTGLQENRMERAGAGQAGQGGAGTDDFDPVQPGAGQAGRGETQLDTTGSGGNMPGGTR